MKRPSSRLSIVPGSVLAVLCVLLPALGAAPGCGAAAGPSGDPAAAVASCNAYCDAYITAACATPNYMTADDCRLAECHPLAQAPGICVAKIKTYYDCAKALGPADICGDTACADQFGAVLTCQ